MMCWLWWRWRLQGSHHPVVVVVMLVCPPPRPRFYPIRQQHVDCGGHEQVYSRAAAATWDTHDP